MILTVPISVPCEGGHFLNTQTGCLDCPENHFSPGGMLTSCVPCPEGRGATPGSAANEQHCRIPLRGRYETRDG